MMKSLFKLGVKRVMRFVVREFFDRLRNDLKAYNFELLMNGRCSPLTSAQGSVVVSLTTYGQRVYEVHLVIESLGNQSVLARDIFLWLDEGEFSEENVPASIKNLQARGLTIGFCKNIRSFKKIIPTLNLGLDVPVVTVDDDYIYPSDLLERLIFTSKSHPDTVVASFVHKMKFLDDGRPAAYALWEHYCESPNPDWDVFPVGAGGVLYPPSCFDHRVTQAKLFLEITPTADDVWLKYMCVLNGTRSMQVVGGSSLAKRFVELASSHENPLYSVNVKQGQNDRQISDMHDFFTSQSGSFLGGAG